MSHRKYRTCLVTVVVVGTASVAVLAADDRPTGISPELTELKAVHPGMQLGVHEGRVTRIYGDIDLTGRTPADTRDAFIEEFIPALGVEPDDLLISGPQDVMRGKFTVYYLDQTYNGVAVEHGTATVVVRNDLANKLVLATTALVPAEAFAQAPPALLRPEHALKIVKSLMPDMAEYGQPGLIYYTGGETPRLAYTVIIDNLDRADRIKAKYYVDAANGQILDIENMILNTDVFGHVGGYATPPGIYPDQPGNEPVLWDLAGIRVAISGGNSAYANGRGNYVLSHGGTDAVTVTTDPRGQWVDVNNTAGSDLSLSQSVVPPGPADFEFNSSPTQYNTAQVNGFLHTEIVHNWVKNHNPFYPGIDTQLPCYVNINDTCNAYYDYSSINFFRAGGGCPNTAYASVIYHEYGHHVVASGHSGATGDYHEGMADAISCLILDTKNLGMDFFGPGTGPLRDIDNPDVQYPCSEGSHYCGRVLAGAIWDTKVEMVITEGNEIALQLCGEYSVNSILFHPNGVTPQITIDWLTLDDDDGDIGNGTPHYYEIATGFGNHNLPAPPLQLLAFDYPFGRPDAVTPNQTTAVRVEVSPITEEPQPGTGMLYYRVDGGSFTSGPMDVVSDNIYDAMLPAVDCLSTIEWYVSAETTGGTTAYNPGDAITQGNYYMAIGAAQAVLAVDDDFQTDQGWTVGDPSDPDDATTGMWNRMDPEGTAAQPEDDHTPDPGTICWVTDGFSGGDLGARDVDNGKTTLMSPTFDLSEVDDAIVSYWRWYSNDTGATPHADIFVVDISNTNGSAGSWVNVETVGPAGEEASGGWFYHEFLVSDVVSLTDQVKIRFVASDEGSGSLVEAAVDDFQLTTIECAAECLGDINGDGVRDFTDFNLFSNAWLASVGDPNYNPDADLNGDGTIDFTDFNLFSNVYLVPCP